MTISAGTRLGSYEIVSRLGAGGMGEVFRARDTRLDRGVAIKVLPEGFASNTQLKLRFEREAKSISQLNHPHICTLYDVGSHEGIEYLVMELIEGETLADRITRGPLPLPEVLKLGSQIADALHAAHRSGIVHRDLKPGNVMLTRSGAKLLDFGLAKPIITAAFGNDAPTEHKPMTAEGTIIGTFQYMAPEQLEGVEADARTDIFALGTVLYEMATGKRAFEGKTRTSLIAAIVDRTPTPISQILPLAPVALEHIVSRCLEKDPDARWQSAHDVGEELKWISSAGSLGDATAATSPRNRRRERVAWLAAALLLFGLVAALVQLSRGTTGSPAYSFTIPSTTSGYVWGDLAEISPDGSTFVFTARKDSSAPRLVWLRPADDFTARPLEGTEGADGASWSSDSRTILFNAAGKLKRIRVDGSAAEVVSDRPSVSGHTMNGTGTVLFGAREEGIYRVSKGGSPERITTLNRTRHELSHGSPHFLPDDEHFLFLAFARDAKQQLRRSYLYAGALGSKDVKFLGEIPSQVVYTDSGHLLFVRDGSLVAAPFDARKLAFIGEPMKVVDRVAYFKPAAVGQFTASRNGVLAFMAPVAASSLVWLDGAGKQLGDPLRTKTRYGRMRISGNGSRAAIAIYDPAIGTSDIWSLGLTRKTATRLTIDEGWEDDPVFTPDGTKMFYATDRVGIPDIFVKRLDSAEEDRAVVVDEGEQMPFDVSPDGRYLIYESDRYDGTRANIWILRIDGSEKPRPFVHTPSDEVAPRISLDGKWLAYVSNESGKYQVYVKPFPGPGEARQISTDGGGGPRWSPDSRLLYFREADTIFVADLQSPDAEPRIVFKLDQDLGGFEVAPDGKKFLAVVTDKRDADQPTQVMVNWLAAIQRK